MPESRNERARHKPKKNEPSNPGRRRLLLGAAAGAGLLATGIGLGVGIELKKSNTPDVPTLTDMLGSTWESLKNPETQEKFLQVAAEQYMSVTQSTRVTAEGLVKSTTMFNSAVEAQPVIKKIVPEFLQELTGAADFESGKVYVDMETLTKQNRKRPGNLEGEGGLALLGLLWHEWGHLDIETRTTGELLNNPDVFFHSPVSNLDERFLEYRGGEVLTHTFFGFKRFEEIWNETVALKLQMEGLKLPSVIAGENYFENGTGFFLDLVNTVGITAKQLYEMHATSDFEGFARAIGKRLPGNSPDIYKGVNLFIGIHRSNSEMIKQTGALELLPK